MRTVTSALYVDFDNIFSGLGKLDRPTAEAFANDPGRLLRYLGQGRDESGDYQRRFLVRDCYINPHAFAGYRAQFVAAGFRVIDCPSLTQSGNSAADIHLAIDVVDAISHRTRYDEFVICSADADFSPLMTKLRRHDRRTVMVAAGATAPAYQAVCDMSIGAMEIVAAFAPQDRPPAVSVEGAPDLPDDPVVSGQGLAAAVEAVRIRVAQSDRPVPGATAAGAAIQALPGIVASQWAGSGGFTAFVREHLPELSYLSTSSGGLVLDPARHAVDPTSDVDEPGDIRARVARVTGVPPLTSAQYAVLFRELAIVAQTQERLFRIGYDVRDRAAATDAPFSRKAVDYVVTGLVYAGSDPRTAGLSATGLASRWANSVLFRCEQAGLALDEGEIAEIVAWIAGGLPADGGEGVGEAVANGAL